MRLIDADALIKATDGNPFTTESVKSYIRVSVAHIPTIEERKTGRWIYQNDGYLDYYECSECGHIRDEKYPVCEWCGAKMEVEHDNS